MNETENQISIFAYLYEKDYVAEHIIDNLDDKLSSLEYKDVKEGKYQIWGYPNCKIFDIQPDRELEEEENQFSTPYSTAGTVWLPKLVEVGQDMDRITEAYNSLKQ